ncbi:SDR family NAD(P)-dependent oxidoreductase [Hwanghaeella grinnelliae]|uniref:SDR family NAD(P)-dependent oxidoreductase n=1 Tax=Hwanghaeella grinnelliae TaxID=2500179 RepID=A0A437QXD8_9PROT|nr:SDR family NAD(P)-dependent oxidoreductase [Hwanghaeella grinnelliae]RVU39086.1 SDR family NAD(P)-dependent oxidoreductase [Hwanghaeella grinnelliae]
MSGLLPSFGVGIRAAVIGANGGIGAAVVELLAADPDVEVVYAYSRSSGGLDGAKIRTGHIDIQSETSIEQAAAGTAEQPLHLVFMATGLLHDDARDLSPEKSWRALNPSAMAASYAINTIGPALVAKHFLPRLDKKRRAAFSAISARVGSISDNQLGGWYSYRASKAALNQVIKTCAIELARKNPSALCVGLHPGTVDTGLSKPFQRGVPSEKLFTPDYSARAMLGVLDGIDARQSGSLFAWDGQKIPF